MNVSIGLILLMALTVIEAVCAVRIWRVHALTCLAFSSVVAIADVVLCLVMRLATSPSVYPFIQWTLLLQVLLLTLVALALFVSFVVDRLVSSSRRLCVKVSVVAFLSISAVALSLYGALVKRYQLRVNHVSLALPDLPPSFDGFSIALIGDTHLGSFGDDLSLVKSAVDSINASSPDAVVFIGDLVNCFASEASFAEHCLAGIVARQKLHILGNHDCGSLYHSWCSDEQRIDNEQAILDSYARMGFELVDRPVRYLVKDNDTIAVVGLNNPHVDWLLPDTSYFNNHFSLMLLHSPEYCDWAHHLFPSVRVMLCGHTHGGQVALPVTSGVSLSPVSLKYSYTSGLYTVDDDLYIYVNDGLGVNNLPLRLGTSPEVTILTLHR